MSDKTEETPKKKKGGVVKLLMIGGGLLVLIGGGVGAGLYAASSGLIGGGGGHAAAPSGPRLVPASEQKPTAAGEGGGHGEEGESKGASHGQPTPAGSGGDKYASNYYTLDKEFTSNLKESVHFIQVGVAVSTPYDDTVINNLKTHEIAVRSAILMELGNTEEDSVFAEDGKRAIQKRLTDAINRVLKEKTGFGGISNVYFTNFVVQ
ncbi:flagellar basal body-associated FliL family protein [Sphingomonas cannabina]|uniref:flagellar basal body-associated FliL family protein n=1 Tax=Sphingomonas cannabina TaxID=2899123 RepID=UPI001F310211|nr:flagellar basal body-associated FliL family protein [Sphingomonas cannabina]UIJ45432.1 flagellar basal body-associated FliL family protein [Sphingomonas cannabina]